MRTDVDTATAISSIDQRRALLADVRAIVERNGTALVDAIAKAVADANQESFDESERELRDELQFVLRADRRRRGE